LLSVVAQSLKLLVSGRDSKRQNASSTEEVQRG
jgi:hypothetical protein